MLGGGGGDLTRDAAETLLDELLEGPARAVAGEHGQVVDVDVGVAVSVGDFVVVDLREPVVGGDGARVGEDQTAHRVGDGGVLLDAPVGDLDVGVHDGLVVQHGGVHVSHLLVLAAVQDVGLGHVVVAGQAEHALNAVLDVLHRDGVILDLGLEIGGHLEGEEVDDVLVVVALLSVEGQLDGVGDFLDVEVDDASVTLEYGVHRVPPVVFLCIVEGEMAPGRCP